MAFGKIVAFEPIREVAFGGVGVAYAAVGTATIDYTRLFGITSTLDEEVYISFDGVTNHLRIAVNSFKLYDLATNAEGGEAYFLPQGTTFYVKRVAGAPTAGNLWIEAVYGAGGI